MTLGRRHLRGTTQIAAKSGRFENPDNGRYPPESLPEAPGRPSESLFKTFLSAGERLSVFARFPVIPIKAHNYNI